MTVTLNTCFSTDLLCKKNKFKLRSPTGSLVIHYLPKLIERCLRNRFAGQTIDEIVFEMSEVFEKGFWMPKVSVEMSGGVRDQHGLST